MGLTDRRLLVPIIAIVGFVFGIYIAPLFTITSTTTDTNIGGVKLDGYVTVIKTDGTSGEKTVLLNNKHNLFTLAGRNMTRDYLLATGITHTDMPQYISVSNDTPRCGPGPCGVNSTATSGAFASNITYEFVGCGLGRASATQSLNATPGVWIMSKVFTVSSCTGTVAVNATGLFNFSASSSDTGPYGYFAGNNFTDASLTNNDQLNVSWTIAIT